jgi:tetratricopeptide (TPR) repeat protein
MGRVRQLLDGKTDSSAEPLNSAVSSDHLVQIAPVLIADAKAGIRAGLWNRALESLNIYTQAIGDDPQVFYLKGKIQQQQWPGRPEEAEKYYRKAIELDNNFAAAHLALGMISYKTGRLEMARIYFETGLALTPQDKENAYFKKYLQRCID